MIYATVWQLHLSCTLGQLLRQTEWQPVFKSMSPREVYEREKVGNAPPKGLNDRDVIEVVEQSLRRARHN